MTKRLLALFLVCILAIPILAVPASATSNGVTGTQFDQFTLGLGNLLNSIEENILDAIDTAIGNTYTINENLRLWFEGQGGYLYKIYLRAVDTVAYLDSIDENVLESSIFLNNIQILFERFTGNLQTWITTQTTEITTTFTDVVTALQKRLDSWLGQIVGYLDEIRFGNQNNQSDVDNLGDEIEQQETQFQENMEVVTDVTKPTYENIDVSPDGVMPGGFNDETSDYFLWLNILATDTVIYNIFFMAMMMSLVSFVVFGKR